MPVSLVLTSPVLVISHTSVRVTFLNTVESSLLYPKYLMALCCLVMKLILLSLLFNHRPHLTFLGPCPIYTSPVRLPLLCHSPFMPISAMCLSVPLVVFPVLNFIQDVDILLSFQDPRENTFFSMSTRRPLSGSNFILQLVRYTFA